MVNKISPSQIDTFFIRKVPILTDILVPTGQNYVALSVAGGETPAETLSFDLEIDGVIAASLPGAVNVFSLNSIAGPNVLDPKNLIKIRNASNLNSIFSASREIFGLLQVTSNMVTGDNFNDTDELLQISFVRENSAGTALEECPVSDIENISINYQYNLRLSFENILETDYRESVFQEQNISSGSISRVFLFMGG